MELFDKIGEVATQTYKYTTEKADKFAKETKMKMKINENKTKIETLYNEIGEAVYRMHMFGKNEETEKEVIIACEEIDEISKNIAQMSEELLKLKDKKQCKNCHQEIERDAKYCSNCGCEQMEENNRAEEQGEKENNNDDEINNN